jgi:hypothetical protein
MNKRDALPLYYFPLFKYGKWAPGCLKKQKNSPLFEITRVLVRFDHVTRCIVNANHSVM